MNTTRAFIISREQKALLSLSLSLCSKKASRTARTARRLCESSSSRRVVVVVFYESVIFKKWEDKLDILSLRDVSVLSFGHPLCVCPSFGRHFIVVGVHIFSAFFLRRRGGGGGKKTKKKILTVLFSFRSFSSSSSRKATLTWGRVVFSAVFLCELMKESVSRFFSRWWMFEKVFVL